MIRLVIFCILFALVNSEVNEFSDLMKLDTNLLNAEKYIKREVGDDDAAVFFSNTKAGKSTLINFLIGNKLKSIRPSSFDRIKIVKADNQSLGPVIGNTSTSETTIPTKWNSTKLPNLTLWDTPAFDDNRGALQDVTNTFYIYQLVKNVKSLKIILVVDIIDILEDYTQQFVSLLNAVEKLFGNNFKDYFSSISVIFTKVPNTIHNNTVNIPLIKEILSVNILSDKELNWSEVAKNFTQYIIDKNNDRIALFKKMSHEGTVSSDIDVNIFQTIKNSSSINKIFLQGVSLTIKDSSKIFLFKAQEKLLPFSTIIDIENILFEKFQNKVKMLNSSTNTSDVREIKNIQNELIELEILLYNSSNKNDLNQKIEILLSIDADIRKKVEDTKFTDKIKIILFIGKLLNVNMSDPLERSLDSIIFSIDSKVKTTYSLFQVKLGEISSRQHKENMEELKAKHELVISNTKKEIQKLINSNDDNSFGMKWVNFWNSFKKFISKLELSINLFKDLA